MEDKFEVRDKRTMDLQGNPKPEGAHGNQAQEAAAPPRKEKHVHEGKHGDGHEEHRHHEADFLSFLVNLSGLAYMALGLGDIPTEPNLPEAKYIIDAIGMLKEKTAGNLSAEEEKGVTGLLYELKMNFSKVASGKKT